MKHWATSFKLCAPRKADGCLLKDLYQQLPPYCIHAYPKISLSGKKNHPNLEHSIVFRNTSAKVPPHLWNNSVYRILRENHTAILHNALPLKIPRSWEFCLLITLDYPPVQSFHNSAANFRVHTSVTFLVYGDERTLLIVCFFKCLETSHFRWRWFCRCTINRLRHAFPCTWKVFTRGGMILKSIWLAALGMRMQCSLQETS